MANLTILYLYYNQSKAIKFLEELGLPDYDVNFLFIDDGSKIPLKLNWKNVKVLRIEKDIPWNQPQANNLGFSKIKGVVLRMDIDHYFNKEDVSELKKLSNYLKKKELMHFHRITRKGKNPHKNLYMAHVEDLKKAGGYDEDFCGNYGYDDLELMFRLNKKGFIFKSSKIQMFINHKAATKGLERDVAINKIKYNNKR